MKFTININQKQIIERKLDIDLIDAVILDFLADFSRSESNVTIEENGTKFHWFSHEKIIQELPILQLKKDSVFRRLKKLSEKGFLVQSKQSQTLGRSFYAFTDLSLDFGRKSEGSDSNPKGRTKIRSVGLKSEGASDENPNDNNINDNTSLFPKENKDVKNSEDKKSVYSEAVDVYFEFYEKRNEVSPKFDSADGKALKSIISYFKGLHKKKNDGSDESEFVIQSFKYILDNWGLQVDFIRNQTKMTQINSNLNNIINKLKDVKSKSNSENGNKGNKIVGKSRKFTIEEFVPTSNDSSE